MRLVRIALILAVAPCPAAEPPITGKAVPGYEPIDAVVVQFMTRLDATATVVAVSVDGKPAYSRGFGWLDAEKSKLTPPDALIRIASVTKSMTNAILKELFAAKKLKPDDKVLPLIGGTPTDDRWGRITVQHLMDHRGGWDIAKSGDPMFETKAVRDALTLSKPPMPAQVIEYMQGRPLDFDPGTTTAYSNFGYCVLGRVIEKVTKGSFADALERSIARTAKTKDIRLARDRTADRDPREVAYPIPDDAISIERIDAAGGVVASAPALCQFLGSYWVSGDRKRLGQKGEFTAFGSLPGTTSMVRQRNGVDVAIVFNSRRDSKIREDDDALAKAMDEATERAVKRPKK